MALFESIPNSDNAGIRPATQIFTFLSHGAIVKNKVYCVDVSTATEANLGAATTLKVGVAGAVGEEEIFVVALEAASAAGLPVKCALQGWVRVTAGVAIAADESVSSEVGGTGDFLEAAAGDKILGWAPEAILLNAEGYIWFGDMFGMFHA